MPVHKLSRGGAKTIRSAISDLFENLKLRALGPQAVGGKRMYVGFRRDLSLPGIYETAAREEGHRPDTDLLDSLLRVAGNYIDGTKERATARVTQSIDSWLREQSLAKKPASPEDLREKLHDHLGEVLDEMTSHVERILDTEATTARNVSLMDGIRQMNAVRGIDDPTVYFIIVRDTATCDECIRLHLLDDKRTPRVWKLSEVGHGYHERRDENPKIGGLHPHCRCTMATLLPGFGFRNGSLGFIAPGHDEYETQHSMEKSEVEDLEKGARGNWAREGYTIHHTRAEGSHPFVTVEARLGNKTVGKLDAGLSTAYPGQARAAMVEVHPQHRRKGLATALYQRAEEVLGLKFVRGTSQSKQARGLWNQEGRPFGKSEDLAKGMRLRELAQYMEPFGWSLVKTKTGPHPFKLVHQSGHEVPVQNKHTTGVMDDQMVQRYAGEGGLKYMQKGRIFFAPNAADPKFGPLYRAAGHIREEAAAPAMRTWAPELPGYQHVPIEQVSGLDLDPEDGWLQDRAQALLVKTPHKVPAVQATPVKMDNDTLYEVSDGHATLAAARTLGMTHVPVQVTTPPKE